MDKAGSSIVAPGSAPGLKVPGAAPTPAAGGASAGAGGAAGSGATGAAANWKLKIALILLIGVFVFAAAYKLNKTKRAKKGAVVASNGSSSGGGGESGSGPSVCTVGGECKKGPGPISLPGFPGAAGKEEAK